jgi:hypothetical protein
MGSFLDEFIVRATPPRFPFGATPSAPTAIKIVNIARTLAVPPTLMRVGRELGAGLTGTVHWKE